MGGGGGGGGWVPQPPQGPSREQVLADLKREEQAAAEAERAKRMKQQASLYQSVNERIRPYENMGLGETASLGVARSNPLG